MKGRAIGKPFAERLREDAARCRVLATMPDPEVAELMLRTAYKLEEAADLAHRADVRRHKLWGRKRAAPR